MPENTLNRLFSVAATKFRTLVTVKRRDGIVAAFKASCSALSRLLSYRWNRVTRVMSVLITQGDASTEALAATVASLRAQTHPYWRLMASPGVAGRCRPAGPMKNLVVLVAAGDVLHPEALAELARAAGAQRVTLLRDISLLGRMTGAAEPDLRASLGLRGPIFMYVGNLEKYQGADLLLEAWASAFRQVGAVPRTAKTVVAARGATPTEATSTAGLGSLVIIGGAAAHIAAYRQRAAELGVAESVHFLGPRPVGALAALLAQADVLVSPRTRGNNTPMKIYSYLDAGKAVLATALPTHTQVLTSACARLAAAEPVAFGAAIAELAGDATLRARLGMAAQSEARAKYSYDVFRATLRGIYGELDELVKGKKA